MNRFKDKWLIMTCFFLGVLGVEQGYAEGSTLIWSEPVNISNAGNPVTSPQIVGDNLGNAVVIWVNQTTGFVMAALSPAGADTWNIPQQVSTGDVPVYPPAIAMNANGQGVIVYDNGADPSLGENELSFRRFTVSLGVLNFDTAVPNNVGADEQNSGPPLVSIDDSRNIVVVTLYRAGFARYYIAAGASLWGSADQLDGNELGSFQGLDPYALAVDSSGVGFTIVSDARSTASPFFLNQGSYSVASNFPVYTGRGIPAILAGVGQLGNAVAVVNTTDANTWQFFFSPSGSGQFAPYTVLSNISATVANPPMLNVNENGLGVLAYNVTTDSNVHARFVRVPNQTVGMDKVVGQGTNGTINTDEFGDAFAAWINPQGYVSGAWLPVGASTWRSSSQISSLPIDSGTVPAITVLALGDGAIVYAAGDDIRCVNFTLTDPAVIKHGSLIHSLKYNNKRRQKGIE